MYGRMPVGGLLDHERGGGRRAILFLSRRGSGRAMIAEAIVNRHSAGGFVALSAGVAPERDPHPQTEEMMRALGFPRPRAPRALSVALRSTRRIDYVIALWDRAGGERYPSAAGRPVAASWDIPDPRRLLREKRGLVSGRLAMLQMQLLLRRRIVDFLQVLPNERLRQVGRGDDIVFGDGEALRIGGAPMLRENRFTGAARSQDRDVLDLSQAMLHVGDEARRRVS